MGKNKLIVIGAGGHGRSVAEAAILSGPWNEIAFIDDVYPAQLSSGQWPIIASTRALPSAIGHNDNAIIAIGNQLVRKRLFQMVEKCGATMVTVVHPKAWISADATIGRGAAVLAGAIVGTQAKVGLGAIINANATVDHDAMVGAFAHLGVGVQLAGGVIIGDEAWLQAGTCAGYRIHVAAGTVVEPGTALVATEG